MNIFCMFSLLIAVGLANGFEQSNDQNHYRLIITQNNLAMIQNHNANPQKSWKMKEYHQFIDQTHQELSQKYLIFNTKHKNPLLINGKHSLIQSPRPNSKSSLLSYLPLLKYRQVNWTEKGMVSQVKQQGNCGSCYAFAAIGDIQSSFLLKGKSLDLSQQHIVDCSRLFGNEGCNGGWMSNVFAYAMLKGVTSQDRYPYSNDTFNQGIQGSCLYQKGEFKIRSYTYTSIRTYDCQSLANMVMKRPISVAVAVDMNFFYYWYGILNQCGQQINHGVQLTGIYEDSTTNYWMIKNSWGVWWGMDGYANLDRYSRYGNICEICYAPSYSIV